MDEGSAFIGAKLALFLGDAIVVILRDDTPGLPWAGYLDFPGGGREGGEDPAACVLRETHEELGLMLTRADLMWSRRYVTGPTAVSSWFFAARIAAARVDDIVFGDEGQGWSLMSPAGYLADARAIPHFSDRLRDALADIAPRGGGT